MRDLLLITRICCLNCRCPTCRGTFVLRLWSARRVKAQLIHRKWTAELLRNLRIIYRYLYIYIVLTVIGFLHETKKKTVTLFLLSSCPEIELCYTVCCCSVIWLLNCPFNFFSILLTRPAIALNLNIYLGDMRIRARRHLLAPRYVCIYIIKIRFKKKKEQNRKQTECYSQIVAYIFFFILIARTKMVIICVASSCPHHPQVWGDVENNSPSSADSLLEMHDLRLT